MKTLKNILLFTILAVVISCNQHEIVTLQYLDNVKPSIEPQVFAKGFISRDSISEFGSVFNKKGTEFFFAIDSAGKSEIKYSTIENGQWNAPITIISDSIYGYNDPFLSPDETKLYYISDQPRDLRDTMKDYDIWYSERNELGWSLPINAGNIINSDADEYYISFTNDGSMYFSSNKEHYENRKHDFDIYKSQFKDGGYSKPQKLGDAINSQRYEADVFIAPDESYIIFCSARKSGFGRGDLYFSYKDAKGNWTNAVNMSEPINSSGHELCPFVTNNGKFLFYTSNQDIYWVSTEVLDSMYLENR